MDKCPVCKKFWEETWNGTEYCPQCGQTKAQALQKAKSVSPATPKVINHTPEEQYIIDLLDKMYAEHGFQHHPTVFRNRQNSCQQRIGGISQIVVGYQNLDNAITTGFYEYPSISFVWAGQGELTGLKAAWAIALHEFAHVVQHETGTLYSSGRGGIDSNKYHNSNFVNALRELQVLYPFEEVK